MSTPELTSSPDPTDASTSSASTTDDPATRVKALLHDLLEASDKAFLEIENIVQQEVERVGEDTIEGKEWYGFGGVGLFSDAGAAARNIQLQIASVRGMMTYRGLDQPKKP